MSRWQNKWHDRLSVVPFVFKLLRNGMCLSGSDDFAGFQALGADPESLGSIIIGYSDGLQIGQPSALGFGSAESPRAGMLMADILPELRAFSAYITYSCHNAKPPVSYGRSRRAGQHQS